MMRQLGWAGVVLVTSAIVWLVLCAVFLVVDPAVVFWLVIFPGTGILTA